MSQVWKINLVVAPTLWPAAASTVASTICTALRAAATRLAISARSTSAMAAGSEWVPGLTIAGGWAWGDAGADVGAAVSATAV